MYKNELRVGDLILNAYNDLGMIIGIEAYDTVVLEVEPRVCVIQWLQASARQSKYHYETVEKWRGAYLNFRDTL